MSISDRLDEIAARCEAATEGPWECKSVPIADEIDVVSRRCPITFLADIAAPRTRPNAEFIASARSDVPRLAAALRLVLNRHSEHASAPGMCLWCEQPYPCSELRDIESALREET